MDDWGEHIGNEVTNMLPAQFSELTDVRPDYGVDMVPRPPEHDHVFFKATSFLGQIQIGKMVDPLDVSLDLGSMLLPTNPIIDCWWANR